MCHVAFLGNKNSIPSKSISSFVKKKKHHDHSFGTNEATAEQEKKWINSEPLRFNIYGTTKVSDVKLQNPSHQGWSTDTMRSGCWERANSSYL